MKKTIIFLLLFFCFAHEKGSTFSFSTSSKKGYTRHNRPSKKGTLPSLSKDCICNENISVIISGLAKNPSFPPDLHHLIKIYLPPLPYISENMNIKYIERQIAKMPACSEKKIIARLLFMESAWSFSVSLSSVQQFTIERFQYPCVCEHPSLKLYIPQCCPSRENTNGACSEELVFDFDSEQKKIRRIEKKSCYITNYIIAKHNTTPTWIVVNIKTGKVYFFGRKYRSDLMRALLIVNKPKRKLFYFQANIQGCSFYRDKFFKRLEKIPLKKAIIIHEEEKIFLTSRYPLIRYYTKDYYDYDNFSYCKGCENSECKKKWNNPFLSFFKTSKH